MIATVMRILLAGFLQAVWCFSHLIALTNKTQIYEKYISDASLVIM